MSSATPQSTRTTTSIGKPAGSRRTPKRAALAGLALLATGPLLLAACGSAPNQKVSIVAGEGPTTLAGPTSTAGTNSAMAADTPSTTSTGTASGTSTGTTRASSAGSAGSDPSAATSAGCAAKTPKAWGKPARSDSFSGTSTSGWSIYHDTTSTSLRDPSQVKVSGGNLELIGTTKNGMSVGGGVSDRFAQKYGRWEACIRADKGNGYYPVITIWPANNNWPTDGEIDLLESVDGNRLKNIFFAHNNAANNRKGTRFTLDLTQWHEFAVDWTPTKIVYYVDGVAKWTMDDQNLVPSRTTMHITFQLDPRNKPKCRDSCRTASTPAHPTMYVDWMRAYKYDGQAG